MYIDSGDWVIVRLPIGGQVFEVRGVARLEWLAGDKVQRLSIEPDTATVVTDQSDGGSPPRPVRSPE